MLCLWADRHAEPAVVERYTPYLIDALERWPDMLRVLPWRWARRMMCGDVPVWLALVRTLSMPFQSVRLAPLRELCRALGDVGQVTQLFWSDARIGSAGATVLARSSLLDRLDVLDLAGGGIGDRGARVLAKVPLSSRMQLLCLDHNYLTVEAIEALSAASWQASWLSLSRNRLGAECVPALSALLDAWQPQALDLGWSRGRRPLTLAWGNLYGVRWVEELGLSGLELDASALSALLANTSPALIRTLSLNWNQLGEHGVRALCAGGEWRMLEVLDLRRNMIGDVGAMCLAQAELPNLRTLRLEHNGLSARGRQALMRAEWFGGLHHCSW